MSDASAPDTNLVGIDLMDFTKSLIRDLELLRTGEISVQQARAAAEIARQVIRAMHLVVTAQRLIEMRAVPTNEKPKRRKRAA